MDAIDDDDYIIKSMGVFSELNISKMKIYVCGHLLFGHTWYYIYGVKSDEDMQLMRFQRRLSGTRVHT